MPKTDTPFSLRAWMDEHGWSVRKLALRLDAAPRTVQAYASGEEAMPFIWTLALESLDGESGDDWRLVEGELLPAADSPAEAVTA